MQRRLLSIVCVCFAVVWLAAGNSAAASATTPTSSAFGPAGNRIEITI